MNEIQQRSFLILSDIHYGSFSGHCDFAAPDTPQKQFITNARPMKDGLIEVVKSSGVNIDAVLVPGDLTSTARPSEFKGCLEIVEQIANDIHVPKDKVFYTFGNHDTDWRISSLADSSKENDEGYLEAAAVSATTWVKNPSGLTPGPLVGTGIFMDDYLNLFIVNSGFFCTSEQTYPHGRLGEAQLNWLRQVLSENCSQSKWNILVVHHHPFNYPYPYSVEDTSCLQEGAELIEAIGGSPLDFICHGHRHHPIIFTELRDSWVSPITFFCAGSVSVDANHRTHGEIPNLFHILTLEERSASMAAVGIVRSYEYSTGEGWMPITPSSKIKMDAVQRFGACATATTRQQAATKVIQDHSNQIEDLQALPPRRELPLELQCMTAKELNALLKVMACEIGVKLLGTYSAIDGDEVFIRRT